ncbi:MAG: acyl-CoA reductase [Kofleriaceae bacterium]
MTAPLTVHVRVPARGVRPLADVLAALEAAPPGQPFAEDALALADRFSRRLMASPLARTHPELMALGFFMRKAELARARAERAAAARPDVLEVPLGLVFHVPPANVDTIFMYSWLQSMLAGNANVVRLSSRSSPVVEHLCALLDEVLAEPDLAALRARVAMVQYGHDDALTAALSARADLRVLWGGDAAITAIRRAPLPAHARELTFADRFSLVVLGAAEVRRCADEARASLVEHLFNDLYWFDQAGCSSPRLCVWLGDEATARAAATRLWPALAAHAERRGYHPDLAMRLAKDVFCHRAVLDGPVTARHLYGPALTILDVASLDGLGRDHPGAGLLYQAFVASLEALEPWIARKDQTLTYFGVPREELLALAQRLAGRGLDRLVPVGQALQMARFWDGYDLASEFVRRVHVPL